MFLPIHKRSKAQYVFMLGCMISVSSSLRSYTDTKEHSQHATKQQPLVASSMIKMHRYELLIPMRMFNLSSSRLIYRCDINGRKSSENLEVPKQHTPDQITSLNNII